MVLHGVVAVNSHSVVNVGEEGEYAAKVQVGLELLPVNRVIGDVEESEHYFFRVVFVGGVDDAVHQCLNTSNITTQSGQVHR